MTNTLTPAAKAFLQKRGVAQDVIAELDTDKGCTVTGSVLSDYLKEAFDFGKAEGLKEAAAKVDHWPEIQKRIAQIEGYYDHRLDAARERNYNQRKGLEMALVALEAVQAMREKAASFEHLIADVQWWFLGAKALRGKKLGEIPDANKLRDLRDHLGRLAPQRPTSLEQELPF